MEGYSPRWSDEAVANMIAAELVEFAKHIKSKYELTTSYGGMMSSESCLCDPKPEQMAADFLATRTHK